MFFPSSVAPRFLHSFPTRRSSDLSHPAIRALLAATGRPLAAPSANASGSISPTRAEHVLATLGGRDRKSTRLNSSHVSISYAVFCLKKKRHDLAYSRLARVRLEQE